MPDDKGRRAVAQQKPASTAKSKGRPSLLRRLTSPTCGGLLMAMSPAAQRRELERLAAELEYEAPPPEEKVADERKPASDTKSGDSAQ